MLHRISTFSSHLGSVNLETIILPEISNTTSFGNQSDDNETSFEEQEQAFEEQLVEVQALGELLANTLAANTSALGANVTVSFVCSLFSEHRVGKLKKSEI